MFSNNQRISGRQMNRMLGLDLFAAASMILPKVLFQASGGHGLFGLLAGTVGMIVYGWLLYDVASGYSDNFYRFNCRIWGNVMGWLVMLYFMFKFMVSAVYWLKIFSQVINRTFLTEMPESVIAILMLVTALYSAFSGIEARGRFGGLLFWIVVIPVAFVVLLSFTEVSLSRLFQVAEGSFKEIAGGGFVTAVLFSAMEFILFAAPFVVHIKKSFRFIVKAVLFAGVFTGVIYLACIGVLGACGASKEQWPFVVLMQMVRLPGRFMSRQEGLMMTFWTAAVLMLVGGYVFYAADIFRQLFSGKYMKTLSILWTVAVYFLSFAIKDVRAFEQFYFKAALWGGLLPTVIILVILAAGRRLKKEASGKVHQRTGRAKQ